MSYLFDTNPHGLAGAYHFGCAGLGVKGAVIRATTGSGDHGPGLLYNEWDGPEDDDVEFQAFVEEAPASGVLFVHEDGRLTLTGAADGTWTLVYRVRATGADRGTATATITVGAGGIVASADMVLDGIGLSAYAEGPAPMGAQGDLVLDGIGLDADAASGSMVQADLALLLDPLGLDAFAGMAPPIGAEADLVLGEVGLAAYAESQAPGGTGATAAEIWGYVLPNGQTAGAAVSSLLHLLTELHKLNGLDISAPLTVSATARIAGDVEQALQTVGSIVTVTRVP